MNARLAAHRGYIPLGAIACGLLLPNRALAIVVAALLAAAIAAGFERSGLAVASAVLVVAGSIFASVRIAAIDRSDLAPLVGSVVEVKGHVVKRERSLRGEQRLRLRVSAAGLAGRRPRSIRDTVQLRWRAPRSAHVPSIGDELAVEGRLTDLPQVPGADFDYAAYLSRAGVHAVLRAASVEPTGQRRTGLTGFVDRLRRRAEAGVGANLDPSMAALARGMVLGEDEQIDAATSDDFKRSGLAHVLAVSGQNVALLALLAFALLALTGAGRRTRLICVGALIAIYVPLTGAGPSIMRAGVMGAAGLVAALAGHPASRWYALLGAAAVTLAFDPRAWLDVGWQLSFVAVVGIFTMMAPIERRLGRAPPVLASVLAMTTSATIATAPLMAFHFGRLSVVGLLANVIAAPAIAPVMWAGMVDCALAQFSVTAAGAVNLFAAYCLAYVAAVAHWSASLPGAVVGLQLGSATVLVLIYLGLALLVVSVSAGGSRSRLRLAPASGAVLLLAGVALSLALARDSGSVDPPESFEVTFLDVGQGDATLLRTPGGAVVLVDAGPPEARLYAHLRRLGVRRIDLAIITHPQRDHEGGFAELLARIETTTLIDGGRGQPTAEHRAIVAAARAERVRIVTASTGERFELDGLQLQILSPAAPYSPTGDDPNVQAIVALASYRSLDLLLTADAESDVTASLDLPRAEILKVAHHGSSDDGLPALLERVDPAIATIEVGAHNRYGHPAASTLAALRRIPHVFRTDRDGDVRVRLDHGRLQLPD